MNEIVKPNAALANAANLIELMSNLSNVARDVDTLFRLVEDLSESTNAEATPVVAEPKRTVIVLGKRELAKLPALIAEGWMTLDMLQVFLDAKSRHSAENFLSKVRYADGFNVICQKLPRGKAKMYKIVYADQAAA